MTTLHSLFNRVGAVGLFQVETASGGLDARQFSRAVMATTQRLAAAGIGTGDVVLFHGGQCVEALLVFWATVLRGAVFAPVDPSWPPYLLSKAVARVRPALAVVDQAHLAFWAEHLPALPLLCHQDLGGEADTCPAVTDISPAAPAAYLFTSGSTGDPKVVVHSHEALIRSARLVVETFDWQAQERLLNLPEPHTMSGLRNAFLAAPLAGMTWCCSAAADRQNIFSLVDVIERAQPQRLVAAPLLLRQINLLGARVAPNALASLRAVYCTGADLNHAEVRRFHERHRIPVVNYYGLTETVGLCLSQDVRQWCVDDDSLGLARGCDIRLMGPTGPVGEGEVGELQVCLPLPMSGYLADPGATAQMFDGAWLRTGDLAQRDAQGRFRVVGRSSSFIKTLSTEKVLPQEIEMMLEQHAGVAEAAVCGVADVAGGERIAALIVAAEAAEPASLAADRLADFVRLRLGAARVPAIFRVVPEIPRSANGKILRKQLRALLDEA